jgi:hypothetical protein
MLHQPTLEKLESMRLHGMAQAWRELAKTEQASELSFEERMPAGVLLFLGEDRDRQCHPRRRRAGALPSSAPKARMWVMTSNLETILVLRCARVCGANMGRHYRADCKSLTGIEDQV